MLGWVFTAIAIAVSVVIAALLGYAIWRRRLPPAADVERNPGEGLRWIGIGTGISTVILLAMAVYALLVLGQVGRPPATPALTIHVTGYDWWWRADYLDAADGTARFGAAPVAFSTANEIHIPVGQPVRLLLDSADVIHAFWVPQLAGKTQMIPGLTNQQWLQADAAGVYRGQCTQFCGVQHAHMAFEVVADEPAAYQRWLKAQQQPASAALLPALTGGRTLFMDRCAGCHTLRGTPADGNHGPDLTHLASRRQIAAGLMDNTPANLMNWITHAQTLKPGSRMPSIALDATETRDLSTFLASLQ